MSLILFAAGLAGFVTAAAVVIGFKRCARFLASVALRRPAGRHAGGGR